MLAACPILIERERELDFLERAARSAGDGGPAQLVLVTGEAGAGKSRLTEELVALLAPTWSVLRLGIDAGMPVVGEAPAAGADRDWAGPAAVVAAALHGAGSPDPDHSAPPPGPPPPGTEALPVLAVVEDAERLDPAGLRALAVALDRLRDRRVLLVVQVRLGVHAVGSDYAATLADLLRDPTAHELTLPALSHAGLSAMADALGRHLDDDAVSGLHERTAGNPFFSEEFLLAADNSVPWTVTEAVMRRLAALPAGALPAAEILAVAGDPLRRDLVEDLTAERLDTKGDEGHRAVGALLDAGVGRQVGDQVALRHTLVGEVLAGRLAGRDRQALHRQLAERLEATGAPVDSLARHWSEAGDPRRAAIHAATAADRAADRRAYATATDMYRVALAHPPPDGIEQAELYERAAAAAGWAGMSSAALAWAQSADASYRRSGAADRALAMWVTPGLHHLPKPQLRAQLLPSDQVERLLQEAREATRAHDHTRAAELSRRALQVVDETGTDTAFAVLAARSLMGAGELDEGQAHLNRVRAMASAADDQPLLANVLAQLAIVAMARADLDESLALDLASLAAARRGLPTAAWLHEAGVALIHATRGELDDADAYIERLEAMGQPMVIEYTSVAACFADLERDDLPSAANRLKRMAGVASIQVDEFTAGVLLAQARWLLGRGDPVGALAALDDAATAAAAPFEPSRLDRLWWQVRIGTQIGDAAAVADAGRGIAEMVALHAGPGVDALGGWFDGWQAAHGGRPDEALAPLAEAALVWEKLGRFPLAADTWVDVAEAAAAAANHTEFDRAHRAAEALAEPRGLRRVLRRLAQLTPPLTAPDRAWGALTAREREIAELAAAGRTNRQIGEALYLSEHTVRNQLVKVFDKLGIARRGELARTLDPPRETPPGLSAG